MNRARPAFASHFGWRLTLRTLILFVVLLGTSLVIARTQYLITPLVLGLLCIGLMIELLFYMRSSNRDLARFLSHIEFDDYAQRLPAVAQSAGFDELADAMNRVIQRLGDQRLANEQERRTLQAIIENVPSPLFSVRDDGALMVHNHAARRLFAAQVMSNVEHLADWAPDLWRAIKDQPPGASRVVRIQLGDDSPTRMALSLADIVVGGHRQQLVSLQNISSDLDASELDAWEQMARVLAHEIMNSLTPVASLASTARDLLKDGAPQAQEKALTAIDTVANRADALMDFVQSYRRFTQLPEPVLKPVAVKPLLERVVALARVKEDGEHITWSLDVEPDHLTLQADPNQLEQVLINLANNAQEALHQTQEGKISFSARINRESRPVIEVRDNGPGVPEARREHVFIPYYSTRRGGSGVGLALSRQVMGAHGGSISVRSSQTGGAVFRLQF